MPFLNSFLLILLGGFIFFSVLFLLFLISNTISLFFGAPYVKSKKKVRERMLKIARIKENDIIFDLGSGDATLLIEAAKRYDFKRACGIEINPFLVFISKIKIMISGTKDKVEIKQNNFLIEDLSRATIIFSYLLPGIQIKLGEKFKKQLRPGTRIISYAFPFPSLTLRRKIQCSGFGKIKKYIREYVID